MLIEKQSRFLGKKLSLVLFLIIVLVVVNNIISNPIMIFYINEFMFDSTGWKMELHSIYSEQDSILLDGWCLTSKTDTAYFKDGIYFQPTEYTVITQNDLQTHLDINLLNDSLTLCNNEGYGMDRIQYGDIDWYFTPSPKVGQSICLSQEHITFSTYYFYYLDNTPTMGFENDTLNATGYINGFVRDSLDNPISNVKVIYRYIEVPPHGYVEPLYVETDSSGYYIINDFSVQRKIEFEIEGYSASDTLVQIWPDSTVTINIQMKAVVGITELPSPQDVNFLLTQNYPNPFNSSTSFIYSIAEDENIEINIYDEKGELVQRLFKGYQNKGEYKVNWNADNLASGIYFYELNTGNGKISRKCILLK